MMMRQEAMIRADERMTHPLIPDHHTTSVQRNAHVDLGEHGSL